MHANIGIVGAGLMGKLLAWQFLHKGATITLFDRSTRDNRRSASAVAAAMLAPYTEAVSTDLLVRDIGQVSLKLWPNLIKRLVQDSGQSIHYSTKGTLVVSHLQDQGDWLNFNRMALSRLGKEVFEICDRTRLMQLEPEIGTRFDQASYFADEGVLCNDTLMTALNTVLTHRNLTWHECREIQSIDTLDRHAAFDWIFDCRGMGAKDHLPGLRGVRGEVIRVYAPEVDISRPVRLMHPRYPLYIAPKDHHRFVIGATQIESDADHPITVRSGLELLSAVYSLHPGFAEAHITHMEVGCRPAFRDNLPAIRVHRHRIAINGLFRHGYLFAPALLQDLDHFITGRQEEMMFPSIFTIDE